MSRVHGERSAAAPSLAGIPVAPPLPVSAAEPQHGRHRRAPEKQASYREVFAIREFRGLWFAQVISYAGDQFAQVAIAILVYRRTGSPLLTALAYALTYLPPIAGGPLACRGFFVFSWASRRSRTFPWASA